MKGVFYMEGVFVILGIILYIGFFALSIFIGYIILKNAIKNGINQSVLGQKQQNNQTYEKDE